MKENVMNNPGQYLKSIRKKLGLGVKAVYMQTGVGDSTSHRRRYNQVSTCCTIKSSCEFLQYKFN